MGTIIIDYFHCCCQYFYFFFVHLCDKNTLKKEVTENRLMVAYSSMVEKSGQQKLEEVTLCPQSGSRGTRMLGVSQSLLSMYVVITQGPKLGSVWVSIPTSVNMLKIIPYRHLDKLFQVAQKLVSWWLYSLISCQLALTIAVHHIFCNSFVIGSCMWESHEAQHDIFACIIILI